MDRELDKLIRILILEGVAGVRPGSWSRQRSGLVMAREALLALDERWFDLSAPVFLECLRKSLQASGLRPELQEEVLMDLLGVQSHRLYHIGQSKPAFWSARGTLARQGFQRGLDVRKKEANVIHPMPVEAEMPLDLEVSFPDEKEAFSFLRTLVQEMWGNAPGKLEILLTLLDHPDWSNRQVAAHLGKMAPCAATGGEGSTYVSRVIREAVRDLSSCVPHHAVPMRWCQEAEHARDLWSLQGAGLAA